MGVKLARIKWWTLLPLVILFSYHYPRFLVSTFGLNHPWTSYLYMYGFGIIYTGSGCLLALKSGAIRLSRPRDRYWFKIVIGGFCYFAVIHAVWILLALHLPYKGV